MSHGLAKVPAPRNEPVLDYAPGSRERAALEAELRRMLATGVEVASVIGGERARTGDTVPVVCPHDHGHRLGVCHQAGGAEVRRAIEAARAAWPAWSRTPWEERAAVFLKAAELLAGRYRQVLNAATMLNQSKTAHQAEIDSACELIDFWRFNAQFMTEMYAGQPASGPGTWNRLEYRPLEGFVFAVTPFNFTSIAGNLPTAPALMGCTVVWKPASSAVLAPHVIVQILEEAGLPPGVVNLVVGSGGAVGRPVLESPELAGIHFTGSTEVFQRFWRTVGERIASYRTYPRLVGETGGKDFIVAHPSADLDALATAIIRGGYEYQGQKCSAASRLYIPDSLWPRLRDRLADELRGLPMGPVTDFRNFVGAVIDRGAFDTIKGFIDHARASPDHRIVAGGECDDATGYFIRPTLVEALSPDARLMREEIFGPVVTAWVYPEARYEEALATCDGTSPYALTGAVFARDRRAIALAHERLWHAAGNFYVNDKPTGAVVGQQPFGGARASGTNDKAGSPQNLYRWVQSRAIKETFDPPRAWRYPFMG